MQFEVYSGSHHSGRMSVRTPVLEDALVRPPRGAELGLSRRVTGLLATGLLARPEDDIDGFRDPADRCLCCTGDVTGAHSDEGYHAVAQSVPEAVPVAKAACALGPAGCMGGTARPVLAGAALGEFGAEGSPMWPALELLPVLLHLLLDVAVEAPPQTRMLPVLLPSSVRLPNCTGGVEGRDDAGESPRTFVGVRRSGSLHGALLRPTGTPLSPS
eukprot:TRINITY_DN42294_c0_g1_i1.p2 TRINITY_DN42294_c0_g1~~TRINITY_DN42294_c0_g1_i1.p2  ORF type:complete len:215 (+),score=26.61 TRINITY_DN42294_c0_g1_i1:36-680(+)